MLNDCQLRAAVNRFPQPPDVPGERTYEVRAARPAPHVERSADGFNWVIDSYYVNAPNVKTAKQLVHDYAIRLEDRTITVTSCARYDWGVSA